MNTSKHCKQIRNLFVVNIVLSLFWLYWTCGRTINTFVSESMQSESPVIAYSVSIVYCLSSILLIIVQSSFLCAQMKSLKNGNLFHPKGHLYMYIWAVLWLLYDISSSNVWVAFHHKNFDILSIEGSAIGIPVIMIAFAILYKFARQVSEENQLTI